MTWEEFINSEYNDGNFTISSVYVKYNGYNIYCPRVTSSSIYTLTLSTIAENDSYIIYSGGGAD